MKDLPQYTVLYNIHNMSRWIGTGREFFDTKESAENVFNIRTNHGDCCTLRPFHLKSDLRYLGAVHQDKIKLDSNKTRNK